MGEEETFDGGVNKRAKILVVDDEPMVREAMKLLLEHGGHEVEEVDGGEAALARLAEHEFDVVITDFSMPRMQGDQLVVRIREQRPFQRVIMSTGFLDEYKVFGQPGGHVDAVLLKPFTAKELGEAVERVLALEHPGGSDALPPIFERSPLDDFVPPPKP
jgi:CheY-like chemotaxis protein